MTKKIVILLGLCVMAFAAGCDGDGEDAQKIEYESTDPAIQSARLKIAEMKDAYEKALDKIEIEGEKSIRVGGLEDDERDKRQAALVKEMRQQGRRLVDGVKAALAEIPQEMRKAHPIEYLKLLLAEPVYSYDAPGYSRNEPPRRIGISLLKMESNVYGLTPERSRQYADVIVDLFDPGMAREDAQRYYMMMSALFSDGDLAESLAMVERIIEKDPKGEFWLRIGTSREGWNMMKATFLGAMGKYDEANEIYDAASMFLEEDERERQEESQEMLNDAKGEMEMEKIIREKNAKKTSEEDRLPKARITFVGEDGTDKGAITVLLFEDNAFNAVANFISLAESGYYNDKEIFASGRLFLLAASKYDCGIGNPDYSIEAKSDRGVFRGTLAYSKGDCGKFSIFKYYVPKDQSGFVAFGRIVEGVEVIDTLAVGDRIKEVTITDKRKGSVYEPEKEKKDDAPRFGGSGMPPAMPQGPGR